MKNFNSKKTFLIFIACLIALSIVSCGSKSGNREPRKIETQPILTNVRIQDVKTNLIGIGKLKTEDLAMYTAGDTVWMSKSTKIIVNETSWDRYYNEGETMFALVVIKSKIQ